MTLEQLTDTTHRAEDLLVAGGTTQSWYMTQAHDRSSAFRFWPHQASSVRAMRGDLALPDRLADVVQTEVFAQLREFALLRRNWDSYDARPITSTAILKAAHLMFTLAQRFPNEVLAAILPEDATPIATGGLHLEWRPDTQNLMLVEIDHDGRFSYLISTGGTNAKEERNVSERKLLLTITAFLTR